MLFIICVSSMLQPCRWPLMLFICVSDMLRWPYEVQSGLAASNIQQHIVSNAVNGAINRLQWSIMIGCDRWMAYSTTILKRGIEMLSEQCSYDTYIPSFYHQWLILGLINNFTHLLSCTNPVFVCTWAKHRFTSKFILITSVKHTLFSRPPFT